MKKGIKILAIDDCKSSKRMKKVPIVGVIFRGSVFIEDAIKGWLTRDGADATDAIIRLHNSSSHMHQIRLLMLHGTVMAGFNMVDMKALYETLCKPVIAVVEKRPDFYKVSRALRNLPDYDKRIRIIEKNGEFEEFKTRHGSVYANYSGLDREAVQETIWALAKYSKLPEPLRVAHILSRLL